MNNILAQLNSVPMYAICGGIIAFVAVVCVIFLVRSYRAGLAIGIDPARMKRAITSSATFSVLPRRGHPARRHRPVRQPRHAVAVAAPVCLGCAAL